MRRYKFNMQWEGYLFLTPWMTGLLCFTIIPMVMSFYFSFTQYDVVTPPKWIGIENYINLAQDPRFSKSLEVTFKYVVVGIPFQLTLALILATILKKDIPGIRFYRAVYYLPSLLGGSVAVAIMWRQLFNKEGAVNKVLALVGVEGINWIATPSTALSTLILLLIWQFGSAMVIFLGGLKQIPSDYYEAAEIDGCGKVKMFFHITLPLLTPVVFFNIVMGIIGAFQAFTPSYIISGGTGAPVDSTLFYTLYIYIKGFRHFSMGYACALAWILVVIIAVIVAIMFLIAKFWVYYDE